MAKMIFNIISHTDRELRLAAPSPGRVRLKIKFEKVAFYNGN